MFYETITFALQITTPIFLMLLIGASLKRYHVINDQFVATGSKLVFNVALPTFLFVNIATSEINIKASLNLVSYGILATIVVYLILEIIIPRLVTAHSERGVVIQGSFRANMGIVGLAYCVNAFGDDVYTHAAVYLALVTIVFNILSVITLTRWSSKSSSLGLIRIAKNIAKNPLILAISSGLLINLYQLPLPLLVLQVGQYFSDLTLPLALICIGGSITFKNSDNWRLTSLIAANKLIIIPAAITSTAVTLGFSGTELAVIFLMCSAPTATVSYIMVKAIGGNDSLAANAIAVTILLSILTTSIGLVLLRALTYI